MDTELKVSVFEVILVHIFPHLESTEVSLRIQSECGKMRKRITPNTDTFYAREEGLINKSRSSVVSDFHLVVNSYKRVYNV